MTGLYCKQSLSKATKPVPPCHTQCQVHTLWGAGNALVMQRLGWGAHAHCRQQQNNAHNAKQAALGLPATHQVNICSHLFKAVILVTLQAPHDSAQVHGVLWL